MPFKSSVSLADALVVTAFCLPLAAAALALLRFRKQLRATRETKWIAPLVCFLACVMTIAVWALYLVSA